LGGDPERAKRALGLIAALFRIERSLKDAPCKKKEKIRAKHRTPIVEAFFSWCDAEGRHCSKIHRSTMRFAIRATNEKDCRGFSTMDDYRFITVLAN